MLSLLLLLFFNFSKDSKKSSLLFRKPKRNSFLFLSKQPFVGLKSVFTKPKIFTIYQHQVVFKCSRRPLAGRM